MSDATVSASWLEAEYNNRAKVPDFDAIVEGWHRDAAAFRTAHAASELDLAYGPSPRQRLDLFWPDGDHAAAPLALFIHGGYWQALDRSFFSHMAAGLAVHGVGVAVASYDLCPDVGVATIVEQMRGATAFLHRRHGGPVFAFGHSAGGHLAAMLLATDWAAGGLPSGLVPAALGISGLFDLAPLLATIWNAKLRLDAADARRLSPVHLPPPGTPFHAAVGEREGAEYARQSRAIAEAWGGTWSVLAGDDHFSAIAPLADPASSLVRLACGMISENSLRR